MSEFYITTEPSAVNLGVVHKFLSQRSNWARGISVATIQRAIENSLCFSGILRDEQVAFARVVSDFATFANLVDVFVLPEQRGNGYSKMLMETIMKEPTLQGLRRFTLATADAHSLYEKFGFTAPLKPGSLMERYNPAIYVTGD